MCYCRAAVDIASKNSWPVFGREMVSVGEGGGIRVGQIKASGKCVPGARIMD